MAKQLRCVLWSLIAVCCRISADAAEIPLNGHVFTVPDGFTIELAADSKLAPHPISADFDELGRLYVTDSSGTNDPSKKQLEDKPHRIVRLEDTNGDGVFDKSTVWADKLMFPEGAMWHAGSLYVAAPPSIWKLTDTDDDGVADQRVEWFKGETLTGCANDLHGPFVGLDGWIYWCKGAFAEQHYRLERPRPGAVAWDSIPSDQRPKVLSTTLGLAAHWEKVDEAVGQAARLLNSAGNSATGATQVEDKKERKTAGEPPAPQHNGGYYWKTKASHVFRARPDGTGLEPIMTGGMDNPVDIAFLPNGEFVVSNTFLVHPGSGKAGERDGLIHGIYGAMFGKEHAVLDGHPRTGELMPILAHLGAAAPCGLTRYDNDVLGGDYRDNLFCCQFNKHKVSRHVLTPKGATYESTDSDFVVSSNIDFHPTDVFEDADGSLVIVDTGGWYKLCCPTSQLHKPDILGAIYRVRKKDAPKIDDPRGLKVQATRNGVPTTLGQHATSYSNVANLEFLCNDARPTVRRRAWDEYWRRSEPNAFTKLVRQSSRETIARSIPGTVSKEQLATERLLALARAGGAIGDNWIEGLAMSPIGVHSEAALHLMSLRSEPKWMPKLIRLLVSNSPSTRRRAAEAIGRTTTSGLAQAVQRHVALLSATQKSDDRFEQHAFAYALIEIADPAATAEGLKSDNANVRRVAMIALDQMANGGLKPEQVTPLLSSSDEGLSETARWIVSRHPEWGGELAGYFATQLEKVPFELHPVPNAVSRDEILEGQLTQFAQHAAIHELLAKSLLNEKLHLAARQRVLNAMANSKPKELSPQWAEALAKVVSNDAALKVEAIQAARKLPPTKQPHASYHESLLAVANDKAIELRWRLAAMATVGSSLQTGRDGIATYGLPALNDEQFAFVTSHLKPTDGITERAAAADIVTNAKLTNAQLAALTSVIQEVSPIELDRLLAPYERSSDEGVGLKLVATLKQAKALSSLRMDSLKKRLAKYSPAVLQGVEELNALVNVDAATQKARIEELLPEMAKGDIRRGLQVFNSQKASCIACHKLAYLGGNVGPDLSKIGGIRTERDLLESILYPSLSFVRSYEPVTITTHSGKVFNGLIREESPTEFLLMTGLNQTARIARSEIDEQLPSKNSIMPAGLDKQLSVQELADLVAFLKSTK